ncbi:MAG: SAM-dependent methyltransferase [Mycobacterium sp.]|nr:SAM-dependent methyltransferase [Mycobacterium sp.]
MAAVQRALASRQPYDLIDDFLAEPLVRAVGVDFFDQLLDGSLHIDDPATKERMRHVIEGVAVKTRFFDAFFNDAVACGLRQVVILAAGLDTRAYRLPLTQNTVVYEIDQPRVTDFKNDALVRLAAAPLASRRTVGVDLRDDWPSALRACGFDDEQPTAWIAEGLLMYLSPHARDQLFTDITVVSATDSRLAADHITKIEAFSEQNVKQVAGQLQQLGLPIAMDDLIFPAAPSHPTDLLTRLGWAVASRPLQEEYAAYGLQLADDEASQAFSAIVTVKATLGSPANRGQCAPAH